MTQRQPSTEDVTFDIALRLIRQRLVALTCAIGTGMYFDAWLASVQLIAALDRGERLASVLTGESALRASQQIGNLRSIAAPMLALAPSPGIHDVRRLRISDAYDSRRAWKHSERQWQQYILQAHFATCRALFGDASNHPIT